MLNKFNLKLFECWHFSSLDFTVDEVTVHVNFKRLRNQKTHGQVVTNDEDCKTEHPW